MSGADLMNAQLCVHFNKKSDHSRLFTISAQAQRGMYALQDRSDDFVTGAESAQRKNIWSIHTYIHAYVHKYTCACYHTCTWKMTHLERVGLSAGRNQRFAAIFGGRFDGH